MDSFRQTHVDEVGDLYELDEKAVAYARKQRGHGDFPDLRVGDVLVRIAHSGDCFSTFAVFRGGKRLSRDWSGYEGVGKRVRNVLRDMAELPRTRSA